MSILHHTHVQEKQNGSLSRVCQIKQNGEILITIC